jgi:hypothetical protein
MMQNDMFQSLLHTSKVCSAIYSQLTLIESTMETQKSHQVHIMSIKLSIEHNKIINLHKYMKSIILIKIFQSAG